MSDMAASRISVRIPAGLRQQLEQQASFAGRRESEVVREALKGFLARGKPPTCYEVARRAGVVGIVDEAPPDLSTSRKHFEGLGR